METSRKKFKIWTKYFHFGRIICSCSKRMRQGRFQVEVFGKGIEKELSFSAIKVKEGQFSFIVAQHGLDIFVVEIVVGTIHQIRIVDFNCDGHN